MNYKSFALWRSVSSIYLDQQIFVFLSLQLIMMVVLHISQFGDLYQTFDVTRAEIRRNFVYLLVNQYLFHPVESGKRYSQVV